MTSILKVSEIQDPTNSNTALSVASNGGVTINTTAIKDASGTNTAMTIDSSGLVLTPNRPIFSGYRAAVYTTTSSVVPIDVRVNEGSHWNTSTNTWTCPLNGFYVVGVNTISNQNVNLQLRKNGVKWKIALFNTQTSGWTGVSDHEVLQLTAGDTLDFYLVSGQLYSDQDHYFQAYIYLLG